MNQTSYPIDILKRAFEAVENTLDWRGPINAVILTDDLQLTAAAVEFYTATAVTVKEAMGDMLRISAPGYRLGPAGDH